MKTKLLLLVAAVISLNYVEAGIFLKAKTPHIVQDAVWLYSNSTAITSIAPDVPANKFTKSITPLENLPMGNTEGTTGVLYNREDSCSPSIQQPIPLPFYAQDPKSSRVPKIALIKKQQGNCSIYEKILNAQLEGAIGVVLYDSQFIDYETSLDDRKKGVPTENNLKIPAYHVDHGVGKELYYQLEKMAGVPIAKIPTAIDLTTRISVRVLLFPADNLQPTAWELTLLVMIVILGTSILFSVCMHIYMWKKGKALQETVERNRQPVPGGILPMGKPLLTVARLYEFPTRTIDTLPDEEERKKVENVLADEKQIEALINTTALSQQQNSRFKNIFRKKRPSSPSTVIKMTTPVNNMCVVCLEAFKIGDEVRELPCHHEYHCVCIDPWLTSKSGECPLCKFDCSAEAEKPSEAAPSPKGILGFFKTDKNKRNSVLPTYNHQRRSVDLQQYQQQLQRQQQQDTTSNVQAPASPGLRAALRAIEAQENVTTEEQQEETNIRASEDVEQTNTIRSSQSILNRSLTQSEDEVQPRPSTTSTVNTGTDTEALLDIDTTFLTIDLNSILDEHPNNQ